MDHFLPDILSDVRQLSAVFSVGGLLIGLVLWLAGWWTHRFWAVLGLTVLGGLAGLLNSAALQAQPLVAALGMALACGILALTVMRLAAFVAGGYAGLLLAHTYLPSWEQPFLSFLAGALIGWFLFRYWTMVLTSLSGTLLVVLSALALADKLGRLDALAWSERNEGMLNGIAGGMALAGFAVQFAGDWIKGRSGGGKKDSGKKSKPAPGPSVAAFRKAG
jgi:hypothetical protein